MQIFQKNNKPAGVNNVTYMCEGYTYSLGRLILNPGEFYKNHCNEWQIKDPLIFLIAVSSLNSLFTTILINEKWEWNFTLYFLNSFLGTILFALLLYLMTFFVCNKKYSLISVINISAYANVTLLLAWIPGMSWIMGIWRIYLIGIGLYSITRVSKVRVFIALFLTGTSIVCIYNLARHLLCL